jgi:hypothetical protein
MVEGPAFATRGIISWSRVIMAGWGKVGKKAGAWRLASREFAAPAVGAEADIASGGQRGKLFF